MELWGVTQAVNVDLPSQTAGLLLLALYALVFLHLLFRNKSEIRQYTWQQWISFFFLITASFIVSQLFPLKFPFVEQITPFNFAIKEGVYLTLLITIPYLLAGRFIGSFAALFVGAAAGAGRALGQTHQLFDIFHLAFAAYLAAKLMQQYYQGRWYSRLRHPLVAGVIGHGSIFIFAGLVTAVSVPPGISLLAIVDLSVATAAANLGLLLIEGATGGLIATLIIKLLQAQKEDKPLQPAPHQVNLDRTLLNNFLLFAAVILLINITVVYLFAVRASSRLLVEQMAYHANNTSNEIKRFQIDFQGVLKENGVNTDLSHPEKAKRVQALHQVDRTGSFYDQILLVDSDGRITPSTDAPEGDVALTAEEETAVSQAFEQTTNNFIINNQPETGYILSAITPIPAGAVTPTSVMVGRITSEQMVAYLSNLQGVNREGAGFIVNNDNQIIVQLGDNSLNDNWELPERSLELSLASGIPGQAYLAQPVPNGARELLYVVQGQPWQVVTAVPQDIVLRQALSIGGPLALISIIITAIFAANIAIFGQNLTQPITELLEASQKMTDGSDFDTPLDTIRDDEIGQLSQEFIRMRQTLKQRMDELSLLLTVSHGVSKSVNLNQGMPVILNGILKGLKATGARAVIINPSGGMPLTFGEGPSAKDMAVFDRLLMTRTRQDNLLELDSPVSIREGLGISTTKRLPIKSLFSIPLFAKGRFQGILWLGFRQLHTFDTTERNFLQTLSSHASVMVENAHLFAKAEGGRRRLAAVLASTDDAVIVTDQTDRILLINRATERAFGLKASKVIGRAIIDVLFVPNLVEALTNKEKGSTDLEVYGRDQKVYFTNASTIFSTNGQELGRVAVLHDVTHFKEVDKMKSDFVSTVSHDLRSPLTFMRGYATMITMVDELSDKQTEYLGKILGGIDQMSSLVDNLLDLGRIEAGIALEFTKLDIGSMIDSIAEEFWQHAHMSGLKINVEVDPILAPINGDKTLLNQALSNLLMNSIKYAPNSGDMKLKATQQNGELIISLQDHGPGIAKQDQMQLFEKFYRVKRPGTERIKGTGLGLSIVRSIAEQHGGQAWCHSQLGKGSTFFISIPVISKF